MHRHYPLLLLGFLCIHFASAQEYSGDWAATYSACQKLHAQGNYLQSDSLARFLVNESKATYGAVSEPYLQSLAQLSETQEKMGQYRQAASLCQEALQLSAELKGTQSLAYARACSDRGWLFLRLGDYSAADSLLNLSLEIQQPLGTAAQSDYAETLDRLGLLAVEQQDYEAAQPLLLRAAQLRATTKGLDYGRSLYHLGEWYLEQEELEASVQYLDSARVIIEAAVGSDHPENAFVWNHYGRNYQSQGKYQQAKQAFLKALAIRERSVGKEHPAYLRSLENLGVVHLHSGEYEQAEECYLKSKDLHLQIFGLSENYARSILNLGDLYESLGDLEKAEALFLQGKDIYGQVAPNSTGYAFSLLTLARVYETQDRLEEAETYYRETIARLEEIFGKDHPNYGMIALDLGWVLGERGAYKDAEDYIQTAVRIMEEYFGNQSEPYASALNNLAVLYQKQNKLEEAESLYRELLAIDREVLGKHHPDYILSLYNLSLLNTRLSPPRAIEDYRQANAGQVRLLHNYYSGFDESTRLDYLTSAQSRFYQFFSFACRRHNDPNLATEAQNLNLAIKNLAIDYSTLQRVKAFTAGDPELETIYEEWKDLRRQLAGAQSMTVDELTASSLNLDSLENAAETLEKTIGRSSRALTGQFDQVQADYAFENLKQALGPKEAAVDFVHFQYYNEREKTDSVMYLAMVTRPGYDAPQLIPLFEEDQIRTLTEAAILQDGNNYIESADKNYDVYQLVWQPLGPYLKGVKKVYLSPSGLLHRVAFGGLRTDPAKRKFLVDRYQITYRGALRGMTADKAGTTAKEEVVLLGGADFSTGASPEYTAATTDGNFPFNPLPGTRAEVDGIHAQFQKAGWQVETYTGAEAREENVKAQSGPGAPGILHIASHGFFLRPLELADGTAPRTYQERLQTAKDPLFRSGLVFSGVRHAWQGDELPSHQEDGVLTAYEITNMDLYDTDLVVLSACQTGRGDLYDNEGVFGMQRAFRAAGADHLIASLWQIPDAASSFLMTEFYRQVLRGKPYAAALKKAKRKTRKKFKRPIYWAGFILID